MEKNIEANAETKSNVNTDCTPSNTMLSIAENQKTNFPTKSNDLDVIKPTSVTPKVSTNTFEESPKILGDISISVDGFGMITTDKGTEMVKRYTFTNKSKMQVQVISLGATVTSIKLPDKNGLLEDVVLGFDSVEGELVIIDSSISFPSDRTSITCRIFRTFKSQHWLHIRERCF